MEKNGKMDIDEWFSEKMFSGLMVVSCLVEERSGGNRLREFKSFKQSQIFLPGWYAFLISILFSFSLTKLLKVKKKLESHLVKT